MLEKKKALVDQVEYLEKIKEKESEERKQSERKLNGSSKAQQGKKRGLSQSENEDVNIAELAKKHGMDSVYLESDGSDYDPEDFNGTTKRKKNQEFQEGYESPGKMEQENLNG